MVRVALDEIDFAGLLVVVLAGIHRALEREVELLCEHLAGTAVRLDVVLLAVVVEVDLLAGENLHCGTAFVCRCEELPNVRTVIVVQVEGRDLLALGVTEGRVDARDREAIGIADTRYLCGVLALAGAAATSR